MAHERKNMELIKVAIVFVVILVLLNKRLPLFLGMLAGTVLLVLFFGIDIMTALTTGGQSMIAWSTWEVVIALYVITLLQRTLEKRQHLQLAQNSLNGLIKDRRFNAGLASVFIGMMPSAAAVTICGQIMDDTAGKYLTKEEKAFCATYYRHLPEGVLPTFPLIIIACTLSGVPVGSFLLVMLPMVAVLFALGFLFYLRKVPKVDAESASVNQNISKAENLKNLAKSLWTIFFAILVIIVFGLPTWLAVVGVILVSIFVNKFKPEELKEMVISAFEWKPLLGTIFVFVFKDMLVATGLLEILPDYFAMLPIPAFLTLALLFFFGTLVASSTAVGSAFIPLAFSMIPDGGVVLLVLLMGFSYAAAQMSPTHVCLAVIMEYFGVTMGSVIKKTLPVVGSYCVILLGYYLLIGLF